MEFEKKLRDRNKWSVGDGCPMAKTLDLLSTKTTFLVLRECFYGTTRFEDFVERIGASAPAVSRAVKQLESAGIIERAPYQEPGRRVRDEYRLTPAGRICCLCSCRWRSGETNTCTAAGAPEVRRPHEWSGPWCADHRRIRGHSDGVR